MPTYNPGYRGEYTNNLVLPETLLHVLQFFATIREIVWVRIVAKAKHLKTTVHKVKIKPSSYKKIIDAETPRHLAKHLIKEHQEHADHNSDFHISGGVHDAINNILVEIAKETGAREVSDWVGIEDVQTPVTQEQRLFAQLAQETYKKKRVEVIKTWNRLDEFDTPKSCMWFDGKTCLLTVVGPETRYRRIVEITKIASNYLEATLTRFKNEFPWSANYSVHT